jgi:hypothetical protein
LSALCLGGSDYITTGELGKRKAVAALHLWCRSLQWHADIEFSPLWNTPAQKTASTLTNCALEPARSEIVLFIQTA